VVKNARRDGFGVQTSALDEERLFRNGMSATPADAAGPVPVLGAGDTSPTR
jgi:hypothetical protein